MSATSEKLYFTVKDLSERWGECYATTRRIIMKDQALWRSVKRISARGKYKIPAHAVAEFEKRVGFKLQDKESKNYKSLTILTSDHRAFSKN